MKNAVTTAESDSEMPLRRLTPSTWAPVALKDIHRILNDHAHLERKAALNVLDLLPRWPGGAPPPQWIKILSSIAQDEASHLVQVVRILEARGGVMTRSHRSPYAKRLHTLIRRGNGPRELLDRLLISALIELRSYERFECLVAAKPDPILARLYSRLSASERGHFTVFLQLAEFLTDIEDVDARWEWMLRRESELILEDRSGTGLHSWVPKELETD